MIGETNYPDTQNILNEISKESSSNVTTEQQPTPEAAAAPAPQVQFDPNALKYEWKGKEIVEPWDMVKKRASMGYDYAQKMDLLNKKEESWKAKESEWAQKEKLMAELERYKQFDEYGKQNPEWAKHWHSAWEQRFSGINGESNGVNEQLVSSLRQEIADLRAQTQDFGKFKEELTKSQQEQRNAKADTDLDSEVTSIAKEFGVSFDVADERGQTLEYKVLKHMVDDLGLSGEKPGHFKAAFLSLHHPELLKQKLEQERQSAQAKAKEMRANGTLSVSKTPAQPKSSFNGRPRDYEEAARLAQAEWNSAGS